MPRPARVMVDTNVALDLVQNREPFVADAVHLFALAEAGDVQLLLSTDAISTIFYVVCKNADARTGREAIAKLLDFVTLAPLDESAVVKGLALDFVDVEDALVAAVAQKHRAAAIVTRNARDFKNSPVPAMEPKEFLAALEARKRVGRG